MLIPSIHGMEHTRNWADAPPGIIVLIAERLSSIEDCMTFRGVCTSWRSTVLNHPRPCNVSSKTLPWIVSPGRWTMTDDNDDVTTHKFVSLSAKKYYKLNLPEGLGLVSGSPYGWVVIYHCPLMEIFNPLTRVRVPVPPLSTIEGYNSTEDGYRVGLKTVVLAESSSSLLTTPAEDRFIVFVIFRNSKVAFTRPGGNTWTLVDMSGMLCEDILLLNNQAYIVDQNGFVRQFNITSSSPVGHEFSLQPVDVGDDLGHYPLFYLVKMLDDLYVVVEFEFYHDDSRYACGVDDYDDFSPENKFECYFRVFKLDLQTRKWEEVFTLGDYAMFVGRGTSFSLLVSNYQESRSSIYFTYHPKRRVSKVGIFNLETRTLDTLNPGDGKVNLYPITYWFIPNLY